jgi:hypothetical protein
VAEWTKAPLIQVVWIWLQPKCFIYYHSENFKKGAYYQSSHGEGLLSHPCTSLVSKILHTIMYWKGRKGRKITVFRVAKALLSNLYTVARSREPAGKSLQDEVQAEQTGPEQALAHLWLLFMWSMSWEGSHNRIMGALCM